MNTTNFKKVLEEEKAKLIAELETIAVFNPQNGAWEGIQTMKEEDTEADRNEVADKFEEFGNNDAIRTQLQEQLQNVEIALAKIENGTFGLCEVDNQPIEEDRLEANPSARTCKAHMN